MINIDIKLLTSSLFHKDINIGGINNIINNNIGGIKNYFYHYI